MTCPSADFQRETRTLKYHWSALRTEVKDYLDSVSFASVHLVYLVGATVSSFRKRRTVILGAIDTFYVDSLIFRSSNYFVMPSGTEALVRKPKTRIITRRGC